MAKFKGKYRIGFHRRPNWDYSADAFYFLTVCTQHRRCNLGKIENDEMFLSDFGIIVEQEWHKSFQIRVEMFLHEYVIMPNHLHTIVEINNPNRNVDQNGRFDLHYFDNFDNINSDLQSNPIKRNPPIRLPKSISSFMAGYKSAVNTKIDDFIDENNLDIQKFNKNNHFFQPNYHDHIIKDQNEFYRIRNYIRNNIKKWKNDRLNEMA